MSPQRNGREQAVVRMGSPEHERLRADGWTPIEQSFGAEVALTAEVVAHLRRRADAAAARFDCRELLASDAPAVLALDRETLADYPGGVATAPTPLTAATATPHPGRRGFGAFDAHGALIAMTWLALSGPAAEVDLTAVAPGHRRQGIGTGIKAFSLVAVHREGVLRVRTCGSLRNAAILRANAQLGFEIDEHWVTLARPIVMPVDPGWTTNPDLLA